MFIVLHNFNGRKACVGFYPENDIEGWLIYANIQCGYSYKEENISLVELSEKDAFGPVWMQGRSNFFDNIGEGCNAE